jgi:predicted transcriptional regulator
MTNETTITLRLSCELSDKLEALARDMKRSKSDLAREAIASYVDLDAYQVARITEALEEAKSGAPGVRHIEVVNWLRSLGTENELPRPGQIKP